MDITGRTLSYSWPGTFVLIKVKLEQEMDLNLHTLMVELREAADKEISRAKTEESSNRQLLVVENYFGKHAEDKEAAITHRNRYLIPAIDEGRSIMIDFKNVAYAPHSFLSALLATPIKRLGMESYKKIKIINASPEIRETIDFILDENTSNE